MIARFLFALLTTQAWLEATECDNLAPLRLGGDRTDAVFFIGELIAAKREASLMTEPPYWKRYEFTVRVAEPLLGLDPGMREVTLTMPNLLPPRTPAIFALSRRPDGELNFTVCNRSVRLDETNWYPYFNQDLAWLRSLGNGKPERASLVVSIGQEFEDFQRNGLLDGVTVTLSNDRLRREAVSTKVRAQFLNLPAGRYRLTASRSGYNDTTEETARLIEVGPDLACGTAKVNLTPRADSSPAASRPPRER